MKWKITLHLKQLFSLMAWSEISLGDVWTDIKNTHIRYAIIVCFSDVIGWCKRGCFLNVGKEMLYESSDYVFMTIGMKIMSYTGTQAFLTPVILALIISVTSAKVISGSFLSYFGRNIYNALDPLELFWYHLFTV